MPRPHKMRRIMGRPNSSYFKPAGIPMRGLKEIVVTMPEFEAIRLVDVVGKSQTEASSQMKISQPTFSRILDSARKKIAEALVKGYAIRIDREE